MINKKRLVALFIFMFIYAGRAEIDPFASDIRCHSEKWENDFQNRIFRMVESHYPWAIENGNSDQDIIKKTVCSCFEK